MNIIEITDEIITVGSDESLKGDTFGGITIAAVLANAEQRHKLEIIGIKDSKKIADKLIPLFAKRIREICPDHCVHNIYPQEYNQYSLTGLLNRHHSECYVSVLQEFAKKGMQQQVLHIVDKYPGCEVGDISETQAESKYVAVAAASILAREAALKQIEDLSQKAGFPLPKGSSHVEDALYEFFRTDLDPNLFLKTHFKNVRVHLERRHTK